MTNIDIAKGLIFQALKVEKDSFDDRLISQKKLYLLQMLGIDIGYSYNWYIRGPYSPHLSTYVFNNLDVLKEQDFSAYNLSDTVKKAIDKINNLENKKPESLSISSWYELLASVLYIYTNWNSSDVYISLIEHKPQYTQSEFNVAMEQLKELKLCH